MLAGIAVLVIGSLAMNAVMLSRLDDRAEQRTGALASLQGTEQLLAGEEGTIGAQLGDGTGPGVSTEFTRVQIDAPAPRYRKVRGVVMLTLFINEQGVTSIQSSGRADGAVVQRRLYEMWLEPVENGHEGNAILLRAGEITQTRSLKLQRRLTEAPNVTTLEGFTINLRDQLSGSVVATGRVTNVISTKPR